MSTIASKASSTKPAPRAPGTTAKSVTKAPAKAPKPTIATPPAKSSKAPGNKTVKARPPSKPASQPAAEKSPKAKKIKMVRDSFTMPKPEFAVLDTLKLRTAKLAAPTKKTELIRAGIKALAAMTDADLLEAVRAVPNLKTGRPAKVQSA